MYFAILHSRDSTSVTVWACSEEGHPKLQSSSFVIGEGRTATEAVYNARREMVTALNFLRNYTDNIPHYQSGSGNCMPKEMDNVPAS